MTTAVAPVSQPRRRPIRVGVVGANPTRGWGTTAHLPALQALDEYEVVAVATTRLDTAKATAPWRLATAATRPPSWAEIMTMSPAIRRLVNADAEDTQIRDQAYKEGMKPLRVSGAAKIAAGMSTADEVLKVAPLS